MKSPDDVRGQAAGRFQRQHRRWLDGQGDWPWVVGLDPPSETEAGRRWSEVRAWVDGWERTKTGEIRWETRNWAALGPQSLPTQVVFGSAEAVAAFVGQHEAWQTVVARAQTLVKLWPRLRGDLGALYPDLASLAPGDFDLVVRVTLWFLDHPDPGRYLREIPVEGLHTKWVAQHASLVLALGRKLDPRDRRPGSDLETWAGLRVEEPLVRLRVLDESLARTLGGLRDLRVPVSGLAALPWSPATVLIVENHTTGTALGDRPGTVALVGLGNAVSLLAGIGWLERATRFYWGDIDTYGLVILGRARRVLGPVTSLLMDEATLVACRPYWTVEPTQDLGSEVNELTRKESTLLAQLRNGYWAAHLRLEQERIPWSLVVEALHRA